DGVRPAGHRIHQPAGREQQGRAGRDRRRPPRGGRLRRRVDAARSRIHAGGSPPPGRCAMSALDLVRRPRVAIGAGAAPAPGPARPAPPAAVLVSAAVLAVIALFVVWPGLFTSFDPVRSDVANSLQAPSAQHWFGTDRLGRDVWARVVYGARYSVLIGIAATAIGVVGGTIIGIGAGLSGAFVRGRAGRLLDEALTRVIDVLSSLP